MVKLTVFKDVDPQEEIKRIDKVVRRDKPDISNLYELTQYEAYQDYLDQNYVSETITRALLKLLLHPQDPEDALETIRLGLGGKPAETGEISIVIEATAACRARIKLWKPILKEAQLKVMDAFQRSTDLETYKTLPGNKRITRGAYLLEAFNCFTTYERLSDLMEEQAALPEVEPPVVQEEAPPEKTQEAGVQSDADVDKVPSLEEEPVDSESEQQYPGKGTRRKDRLQPEFGGLAGIKVCPSEDKWAFPKSFDTLPRTSTTEQADKSNFEPENPSKEKL